MPNQLTDFDPIHLTYLTSLHPTPLTQSRTVGHCLDSILPDCHGPVAILTFPWLPPKNCPKLWNKRGKSLETTKIREREPQNHYQQHFTKKNNKKHKNKHCLLQIRYFQLAICYIFGGRELWNCTHLPPLKHQVGRVFRQIIHPHAPTACLMALLLAQKNIKML